MVAALGIWPPARVPYCSASFCAAITSASSSALTAAVLLFGPVADLDQVLLQARDRVAQREVAPVVGRPVLATDRPEVECGPAR